MAQPPTLWTVWRRTVLAVAMVAVYALLGIVRDYWWLWIAMWWLWIAMWWLAEISDAVGSRLVYLQRRYIETLERPRPESLTPDGEKS